MEDSYKPIGQAATAFEDLGPTRLSTCGDKPSPTSAPPPHVRRLIAELGLRYRPNDRADLEAHAAKLALLATDVADLPEKQLRAAIGDWIVRKPFLPKANELIEWAKAYLPRAAEAGGAEIEKKRAMLPAMNDKLHLERTDCDWCLDDAGNFYLKDRA